MVVQEPVPVGFLDGSLLPEDADRDETDPLEGAKLGKATVAAAAAQAAAQGDTNALRELVSQGWKPQQVDRSTGSTLHWAAGAGKIEVCAFLLDTWPSLDVDQTNKSGRTALHWAARNSQHVCCEWLVQRKADVAARTLDGINVFHWAVWSGSLDTAKWALEAKADANALNRWGCGAIHWASASGSIEMCAWLRDVGLDFTLRNNQGHDGLSKAAWNGHEPLAKWLLADPLIRPCLYHADRAGLLPADLAQINGHPSLAALLSAEAAKESGIPVKPFQPGIVNQGFVVYYTTQGILSPAEWADRDETLLHRPSHLLRLVLPFTTTGLKCRLSGHLMEDKWGEQLVQYSSQEWRSVSEKEREDIQLKIDCGQAEWYDASLLPAILSLDLRNGQSVLVTGDGSIVSPTLSSLSPRIPGGSLLQAFRVDRNTQLAKALKHSGNISLAEQQTKIVSASFRGMFAPFLFTPSTEPDTPSSLMLFDRIWFHPSCSSDGSFRTHPQRLREWKMADSLLYHTAQIKGLVRALQSVKPRGRLVYSTRSLDPLQNEAVVLTALRKFKGLFELESTPCLGESSSPGLSRWFVPDQTAFKGESLFRFHQRWADIPPHQRTPQGSLVSSLFCPEPEDPLAIQLGRCVRMKSPRRSLDSSSSLDFSSCTFIAVFSRVLDREWSNSPSDDCPPSNLLPRYCRAYSSLPPHIFSASSSVSSSSWSDIVRHFGITNFPPEDMRLVLESDSRTGRPRGVCLVSASTLPLLFSRHLCLARAGLRLFRPLKDGFLKSVAFRWQVCTEAANFLLPRLSLGVYSASSVSVSSLLRRRALPSEDLQATDSALSRSLRWREAGPILLGFGSKHFEDPSRHARNIQAVGRRRLGCVKHAIRMMVSGNAPVNLDWSAMVICQETQRLQKTLNALRVAFRLVLPSLLHATDHQACQFLSCVWTGEGLILLTDVTRSAALALELGTCVSPIH